MKCPPDVSFIIVCMNRPDNLKDCIDSIMATTMCSHEIIVVAYKFTPDNLTAIKTAYPEIKIIESNGTRGFAENNNLALRNASGRYCYIINDDTVLLPGCTDMLLKSFNDVPDNVAVVSPLILNTDLSVQWCGRADITLSDYLLALAGLRKERNRNSVYTNREGLFMSYNISGAAFMINTDVFRSFGFFDEYYFFCPEDIALSTALNRHGYRCYVNTSAEIIHKGGITTSGKISRMQLATTPVEHKGAAHFYSGGKRLREMYISVAMSFACLAKATKYMFKGIRKGESDRMFAKANLLAAKYLLLNMPPKAIFEECFSRYVAR